MTEGARVGLLGAGTVGGALLGLVSSRKDVHISVPNILVRDLGSSRAEAVPRGALTTDAERVLADADIVVELMGGTGLAAELMLRALQDGKRVVTANKAALAERWQEFRPHLEAGRVYFEAAVMAGTPVIGPLSGALRGSSPLELHAILNGTCNYMLSRLEQGVAYDEALAEAQRLGYAEADPTLDVEGLDAAHKLTLLARLAFDPGVRWEEVKAQTSGISHLTPGIVLEAMEDGGRVRLVGSVFPEAGRWRVTVRAVYLEASHPLAGPASNRNGMIFRGDAVGEVFIAGAGAGPGPTASAVLADLLSALAGRPGPSPLRAAMPVPREYQAQNLGELRRES